MKYQVCRDLTPIEYESLKADIAISGVLVPVEVDENGDVLDGHHRIRAWQELRDEGVVMPDYPRVVRSGMTEEQKRNHARKLNVLRRQMGQEEREQIMVDMRKDGMSYRAIAKAVGVDPMTAYHRTSGVEISTPVSGQDGKTYPAQQQPKPAALLPLHESGATTVISIPVSLRDDYDSDEWYTPVEYVDAVRWVFGGVIDLDPASCSLAQTVVQAQVWFDKGRNGLATLSSWKKRTVYLNPPYSAPLCEQFVERFVREYERGSFAEGIALVNNATETQWFQSLLNLPEVQVCFPARRLRFWRHDHGDVGARQGQAIFYVGPNGVEFCSRFGQFGKVLAG